MGFAISKSKVERNQDRKSGLSAKTSKNRNLSNKHSIASVSRGPEGKSIAVLPQFTEGQSAETWKSASDRELNKTPIDFEHRGSMTAWESAEESAGGAPGVAGDVETVANPVSRSDPKYHHSVQPNPSVAHGKEQLEIQELSEDENEEPKTGKKTSPPSPLKEHDKPMRCGTFNDETEPLPSTEKREVVNRIDESAFGGGVTGDRGRTSVEDLIATAAAGLATFTIPRVPRLVTVGVVRTGCLGLGELPQASGLRDTGFFANNELRVKPQDNYRPLTRGKPLENYRRSSFENRFDVLPRDECLDIQKAYGEIFLEGKGKGSGNQDAVDRKDTADQWFGSSSYFGTDSESSAVQTDCRGDFIIALSREMEKIDGDLCASSEAEGKPDCDRSDTGTSGLPVKSLEEEEAEPGSNAASDAPPPSKRGVVFVDVPSGGCAVDPEEFKLANFPDFCGNSARLRDAAKKRSAIGSSKPDQSPVLRDVTTGVTHLDGEAKVQSETETKRTTGKGERESGDGKCLPSREAIQSVKEPANPGMFSKEWDDYDFNTDGSEPPVVGPRTGCDEYVPFRQDDHVTRYSKSSGQDTSEDRDLSPNDFYGQKVSTRGNSIP